MTAPRTLEEVETLLKTTPAYSPCRGCGGPVDPHRHGFADVGGRMKPGYYCWKCWACARCGRRAVDCRC